MKETMSQFTMDTVKTPYEVLRALSSSDDTSLTTANLKDGLGLNGVKTKLNSAQIVFFGTTTENQAFAWTLYGQTRNGFAELIATGTGELGDVEAGLGANTLFANVIAISVQKWPNTIKLVAGDNVSLYISKILFDHYGYDRIQLMMVTNATTLIGALVRWI